MKKTKMFLGLSLVAIAGLTLVAADHIDAPAVTQTTSDITDLYSFQGQTASNLVFVVNAQGFLSPTATSAAKFDETVLTEINIDNNGDNVEDLVIQAIARNGKMYFFGPVAPGTPGTTSTIKTASASGNVAISAYGSAAITASNNGMTFFAGPRDDPFYFDFGRFSAILGGTQTAFANPGTDAFAGTNVLSIVVEVPKAMLGGSGTLNVWAETKKK